ncbi:MAG: hypothetical protein ABDH37_01645 [Candidatus Hydrothermales bacterium]
MKKLKEFRKIVIIYELKKFILLFLSSLFLSVAFFGVTGFKIIFLFPFFLFFIPLKIFLKNKRYFAIELEKLLDGYEGKILTAFIYSESKNNFERAYSNFIFSKLDKIDLKKIFNKNLKREIKVFIFSLFILTVGSIIFNDNYTKNLFEVKEPKEKIIYKKLRPFYYTTQPFIYKARIVGKKVNKVTFFYKKGDKKYKEKIPVYDNIVIITTKPEPGDFEFKLVTENDETPYLKTKFLDPPKIKKINAKSEGEELPLPFIKIKENKEIEFKVSLSFPVDSEKILTDYLKIIFKNKSEYSFKIKFLENSKIRFIHYVEKDSFFDPQLIYVEILKELKPTVKIIYPENDVKVPDNMKIPFLVYASDDIGLDKAYIYLQRDNKNFLEKIVKKFEDKKEDTFSYFLDLDPLNPKPGENFYVYFRVYDKDETKKFSDSRKILIHMPTFEEIYEEVKKETEKFKGELVTIKTEASHILDEIKELREKINENITKSELIKETVEIQKTIEELTHKLEEIERKIKYFEENLVSIDPELNEKIHKITELMRELFSEELKKAYEKLEEAIRFENKEQIEKSIKELIQKREMWKENLERTISLLERIKREYQLKKLVERAKNLESKMVETQRKPEEKSISENKEELSNIVKEMEDIKDNYSEETKLKIDEAIREGKASLSAIDKKNLKESYNKAKRMRENLEIALESFLKKNLEFSFKLIEKTFWGLMGFIKEIENFDQDFNIAYRKFIEEIILETRNTLLFPHEAIREMKVAEFLMDEYLDKIEKKENYQAERILKDIRASLSKSSYIILNFSKEISNTKGSEGEMMENFMQKLSDLIKKQGNINRLTLSILPLPQPVELSEEEKRFLQELAKEQGELLKELSKLIEELEKKGTGLNTKDILEGAAKDMEESQKKLSEFEVTERLKDIQERIMSRLLQAQKSVRKREFVKKRYAERPKPYETSIPIEINFKNYFKILEGKRELLNDENLSPNLKEIILKYYEKLERFENK